MESKEILVLNVKAVAISKQPLSNHFNLRP